MVQRGLTSCSDVTDVIAMRVILNTTAHEPCYQLMMFIQGTWPIVPHSTYDYIRFPKMNGYRTLHTAVNLTGTPIEVQIRTRSMHNVAETGSAAHALYKSEGWHPLIKAILEQREMKAEFETGDGVKCVECLPVFGDEVVLDSATHSRKFDFCVPCVKKINVIAVEERGYIHRVASIIREHNVKDIRFRSLNGHVFMALYMIGDVDDVVCDIDRLEATVTTKVQQLVC